MRGEEGDERRGGGKEGDEGVEGWGRREVRGEMCGREGSDEGWLGGGGGGEGER